MFKAPQEVDMTKYPKLNGAPQIFLAGSIEMGKAVDWQHTVYNKVVDSKERAILYNPRRDDWDSSWKQSIDNPQFNAQVSWELDKLDISDIIFLYFSPGTKSPISLLELGLHAKDNKLIVCCPEGFWRKGNVEMVCDRYAIELHTDLNDAMDVLLTDIKYFNV